MPFGPCAGWWRRESRRKLGQESCSGSLQSAPMKTSSGKGITQERRRGRRSSAAALFSCTDAGNFGEEEPSLERESSEARVRE